MNLRLAPVLVLGALALGLIRAEAAQDKPAEPPAPAATSAVQALLDQASHMSGPDAETGALALADRALDLAQRSGDVGGAAQSQKVRAQQLGKLNRKDEALVSWRAVEVSWKSIGEGPGQIEAIGAQAALAPSSDTQARANLVSRATELARQETKRPRAAVSALVGVGDGLFDHDAPAAAQDTYAAAMELAEKIAPGSAVEADALNGLGRAASGKDQKAAIGYFQRSLTIRDSIDPNSVASARSLVNLGIVSRPDLAASRKYLERAVAILDKQLPDSLVLATAEDSLAYTAFGQGDLPTAHVQDEHALEIRERLVPDTLADAQSLANLGNVLNELGDAALARSYGERAVAILERLAPGTTGTAGALGDLATAAQYQGDLAAAHAYRERAVAIFQKLEPDSLDLAIELNNLGLAEEYMSDFDAALEYHRRALGIREKLAPDSLAFASSLKNLGHVEANLGHLDAGLEDETRALSIREKLAPDSALVAEVLDDLGEIAEQRDDIPGARAFETRALVIVEKVAPHSPYVSDIQRNLGHLAYKAGDRDTARRDYEQVITLEQTRDPDSLVLAQTLQELARLDEDAGNINAAAEGTERAWGIVRKHADLIAGDEARQAFESAMASICQDLVRYQMLTGRTEEAFSTLEEGRAQSLLQMLAERGTAQRLAPPEIWRRYEQAAAASDRASAALDDAGAAETEAKTALDAEVAQQSAAAVIDQKRQVATQRQQQTEVARQAYTRARVEAGDRLTDVKQSIKSTIPPALTLSAEQHLLGPGTVLAAFSVADEATTLFLVPADGAVRAFALPIPEKELEKRVAFVRQSVSRETDDRGFKVTDSDDVRLSAARALYQKLFPEAARPVLANAKRILLSPDGDLWELPFGALVMNDQGKPRYLGLEKPLVYTQSLATLAQAERSATRTRASKLNVLVVGNPLFDNALRDTLGSRGASHVATTKRGSGELALLSRDGAIPEPLPYAEEEAVAVAKIYGVAAATGAEPTEAWFRAHAPQADVIHLATHGYFNPFRPVSSGIRLAVPEQIPQSGDTTNDGALQAWEVFGLSLHAQLVVLSACETGLGAKIPGEGLIGLTRAFQVAGASSVVATLWRVSDRSSADAMIAFHQNLRSGLAKDEALRQAIRMVAANPATADPYYWAPFVLVGDFGPLR